MNIGLSEINRRTLVKELASILADEFVLYIKTRKQRGFYGPTWSNANAQAGKSAIRSEEYPLKPALIQPNFTSSNY